MAQLLWVVEHLADIESDLSAFHRVDDLWSMPGPRFFRLAWRLPAYEGVMRARALAERDQPAPNERPFTYDTPAGHGAGQRTWNPGTRATLQADPDIAGLFSFGSFT